MLGLVFDTRFAPRIDDERARLICEVHRRWNAGETYRKMAPELNISPATASRLRKEWHPGLEPSSTEFEHRLNEGDSVVNSPDGDGQTPEPCEPEPEEWAEAGYEEPKWLTGIDDEVTDAPPPEPSPPPPPETPRDILLALGCRQTYDKNDREIFVESFSDHDRPRVWYRFDARGRRSPPYILRRIEYKSFGTSGMRVDGPVCLFNTG